MKVMVVGSGGREHALAWKITQSPRVTQVFCAPGNAGIAGCATCVDIRADAVDMLLDFAKKEAVDLTVVGPEAPLVAGIVDAFRAQGLKVFGPTQKAAQLEGSKCFAKELMVARGVPTARSVNCRTAREVIEAAARFAYPVVLKADGLAAGKGVVICSDEDAVRKTASEMIEERIFGNAGRMVGV